MKAYFSRLNKATRMESFASYRDDAEEKFIKPLIGEEQYGELHEWYNLETPEENAPLQKLLYQVQRCLTYYTLLEAAPTMMLDFGDGGMMEGAPDGQSAARQWTVKSAIEYFSTNADTFAESVLQFLEKNAADYATWKNSDSRKEARAFFISSGKMWKDAGADIAQPHRFFLDRMVSIKRVEENQIQEILGSVLYTDLKEKLKENDLTEDEENLIKKIKPVVAYYALADSIPQVTFQLTSSGVRLLNINDGIRDSKVVDPDLIAARTQENLNLGKRYEARLRNYLNDNAELFPDWPVPVDRTSAGARVSRPDNVDKKSFML